MIEIGGKLKDVVGISTGNVSSSLAGFVRERPDQEIIVMAPALKCFTAECIDLLSSGIRSKIGLFRDAKELCCELMTFVQSKDTRNIVLAIVFQGFSLSLQQLHFFKALFIVLQRDLAYSITLFHSHLVDF